ncbi:MAG TPA: YncE family protein [Candidatus Dormibacteraeota bacterium]|nr:YncE family protein [Candidatus Dormibacteraeota bacterium]
MLHLVPVTPPARVPIISGFDYVTVDAARRRVYAAHTGSSALLVIDADTGNVRGQVRVGPMHGVAVDPRSGMVYTGDGIADAVSEVDPRTLREVARVAVPGPVDALIFDPGLDRLYADEDGASSVFVIDAKTMRQIGTISLPGHDPEYPAVDPKTETLYQNLNGDDAFAMIDPQTLQVTALIETPQLRHNHPLQFDAVLDELIVGGKNGVLSVYAPDGRHVADGRMQRGVDQCSLDDAGRLLACAGGGEITLFALEAGKAPREVARVRTPPGVHTVAIDDRTRTVWTVWAAPNGDWVQRYAVK